ncbi:WG repeat-containing protein [Parapedobacter sp. ISTM3]|uniref:WG repeat-containing protein n=1 Tax=Parapedobacter sp. ISTM3 TaxID=2800130 RepID=UPI001903DB63|nr:WG repeat-containing protein [Parapedobacter sp. ISTM3]MBK1440011.1 WG repeat-containing protein [Parapedobacter sp. ISTM3]
MWISITAINVKADMELFVHKCIGSKPVVIKLTKTVAHTLLLTVLIQTVAAQTEYTYGFVSIRNRNQHIAPEYCAAGVFSEGLAAVKRDGKWGFINADNKAVIGFQYDYARSFKAGQAIVQQGDFFGVVNREGKLVIPIRYYDLVPYELAGKHYYIARDSTFFQGIIDAAGEKVLPHRYTFIVPLEANLALRRLYGNIPFYTMYSEIDPAKGSFYQQFSEGFGGLFSETGRQDIYDVQFNKLASKNVASYAEHFSASELTSINDYLEDHKTVDIAQKREYIGRLLDTPELYKPKPIRERIPTSEEELNTYMVRMGYEKFSGRAGKTGVKRENKIILPAKFDILKWWGMAVFSPSEEAVSYLQEHYAGRYADREAGVFAVLGIAAGNRENGALYTMKGKKVMELEHNVPEHTHSTGFTYRKIERDTASKRSAYTFGFVNWEGQHILPPNYARIRVLDDGHLLTKRKAETEGGLEEHFGLYNASGEAIIPEGVFSAIEPFAGSSGLYLAEWHETYPSITGRLRAKAAENKRFALIKIEEEAYSVISLFTASTVYISGLDVESGMLQYKKRR